jgi:hypothetical protein
MSTDQGPFLVPVPAEIEDRLEGADSVHAQYVGSRVALMRRSYSDLWPGEDAEVIEGGYRCGIERVRGMTDWWAGYSPRNGRDASVEGPWSDWVALANAILAEDERRRP